MSITKQVLSVMSSVLLIGSTFLVSPAFAADDEVTEPGAPPSMEVPGQETPEGEITPFACNITARSVYASQNLVWTGGTWSGCAAPVTVSLRWSRPGPDTNIGTKTNATSGTNYGWGCNWGTPQNRNLFGTAVDNNNSYDNSTINAFTSATTNCRL